MKSILIALILAPSLILASCEPTPLRYMEADGCGAAYGYDQQGEYLKISQDGRLELYEWEGHLWRPVELRHADECNCGGDYSWDEDEMSPHEIEPAYY